MRWSAIALVVTGVSGVSLVLAPAVTAFVVPVTLSVLLLVLLVRLLDASEEPGKVDRRLLLWTLGAFALHLSIGLAIVHSTAATNYLGRDAMAYHRDASGIVQSWLGHGPPPHLPTGKEGFYYELAGLYYLFGTHSAAGLALNAAAAAALVPLLSDLTRRLFGRAAADYAAPLVVLLPGFLLWTSQLLREASVLFLLAAAANLAVRAAERPRPLTMAGLAATLALLFTFRANVAYVVAGGLVIGLVLSSRRIVPGVSIGATTLALSALLVTSGGIGSSGYQLAANADLQQVNAVRLENGTTAASGFTPGTDVSTPAHAATYLPQGLALFALGPFPWQVAGFRQLPALLDVAVLWALLPSLWRGLVASRRRHIRTSRVLLIPALIVTATLSLLIGNFGIVVRERIQALVFVVPFIALGLSLRAERHSASSDLPTVNHSEFDGDLIIR